MLDLIHIPENHTARRLNEVLQNELTEWGLDETEANIVFVTDNDRALVAAIKLNPNWIHIPCFAHTLQLVVTTAVKVK